jgi:Na+/H+ antiporter NhaD/arsenite permease-like protein
VSLLRKLVPNKEERLLFGAMVVCASNAGGVWTPIGDVTTTMLWINNNLSTLPIVLNLFLPSLASLLVCTAVLLQQVVEDDAVDPNAALSIVPAEEPLAPRGNIVFATGIGALLFVPVFNELTGLPPYLGMLGGLGALWLLTDIIHAGEERASLKVRSTQSQRFTARGPCFCPALTIDYCIIPSCV